MRQPLDKILRKKLEDTVVKARDIVEIAVNEALQRLGVADSQAPSYLNDEQRALRNTLRAHARQLGDKLIDGKQEIERLANEMAYEHWHRMLFSRYLEKNNLLMYDEYTPVTLDECFELAEEEPDCKDGWDLAGRLAQKMLPQIFRADSPVFAVKLSINHINELENLISELDPATYQAQDSLGWCYQFWQNKKKKQVNESGVKIGAQELSPVTQLFTEPYMVRFLLDNTLGAWWAAKCLTQDDYIHAESEQELRDKVSIPGMPLEYLRFIKNGGSDGLLERWILSTGSYETWPEHLSQLKTLDPCCGSGHFLVAIFLMLVPIRMHLEGLSAKDSIDAVLRENIHGLELDQRCVEVAVFAVALEAWRFPGAGGFRTLPTIDIAHCGLNLENILGGEELNRLEHEGLAALVKATRQSPFIGSLLEPQKYANTSQIKLLRKIIEAATPTQNLVQAQSMLRALEIMSLDYSLVVTNPPYLVRGKMDFILQDYCSSYYENGDADLATVFLKRLEAFCHKGGWHLSVTPINWTFLKSYKKLRSDLLLNQTVKFVVKIGSGATAKESWDVLRALCIVKKNISDPESKIIGLSVDSSSEQERSFDVINRDLLSSNVSNLLQVPDYRFALDFVIEGIKIEDIANSYQGLATSDFPRFGRNFWEVQDYSTRWRFIHGTFKRSAEYAGLENILLWDSGNGDLAELSTARIQGLEAHSSKGIVIKQTRELPAALYLGGFFDNNVAVIVPENEEDLIALWCYCSSAEYNENVRKIDEKLGVTNATLAKVSFDKYKWKKFAKEKYPNGLPKPYSNEPTQWIFHGHPCASVIWNHEKKTTDIGASLQEDSVLHVAVARLLGYKWPAEYDPEMELAPEMRQIIQRNADLNELIDEDGIVCIPAVRGEKTAAKRLADILYKSYGDAWSSSVEDNLLKSVKAKDFESWLRDKFFEQHCKLFQHRPFIWHIWDGLKDGFSALVNYHKLDYKSLERLIYTYLDDWISVQKRGVSEGIDGADIRLTAAENLKIQLEAILEGEKGLDIFVRWKPFKDQPTGWNPDINDGIRLNIRPFMLAKDVGKKGAGVLRSQPNINWKKDRGTDVESAPWYKLGLQYGGNLGDRINDHHLTLAEKREAREKKGL